MEAAACFFAAGLSASLMLLLACSFLLCPASRGASAAALAFSDAAMLVGRLRLGVLSAGLSAVPSCPSAEATPGRLTGTS